MARVLVRVRVRVGVRVGVRLGVGVRVRVRGRGRVMDATTRMVVFTSFCMVYLSVFPRVTGIGIRVVNSSIRQHKCTEA